jgi:putative ABC transport system permease protein
MMFRNYFKIAIRHLKRHKLITVINVAGLAVGMACCMLIVLYVRNELSFDKFHRNAGDIYRVTTGFQRPSNKQIDYGSTTQFPIGPNLKSDISSIKDAVRIYYPGNTLFTVGEKKIWEENTGYADAGFFKMFDFPLLEGDPATVLKEPYSIVLSAAAANKYFGKESPVGKTIKVGNDYACTVTGVMKDMPANTELQMSMIQSYKTWVDEKIKEKWYIEREWFSFSTNFTFVQLPEHTNPRQVEAEMRSFTDRHIGPILKRIGGQFELLLQPITRAHLHPLGDRGDVDDSPMIWLYVAIAAFLVLIACINFMNLTTARAHERAKEVGLRKVMGAERKSLILQFLTESMVISVISFILALLMAALLLPAFNRITGGELRLFDAADTFIYTGLLLLVLSVGLVAGSYPALYLSGLLPVRVLKGTLITSASGVFARKGLVVSQFAVAVALIISTVVVYSQLRYWQDKNLGFDKERLVNVYLTGIGSVDKSIVLKEHLLQLPEVEHASMHNMLLGDGIFNNNPIVAEGGQDKEAFVAGIIESDFDLLKTMGIKLISGRDFNPQMATDSTDAFIINKAAARQLGLNDPIGKRIEWRPGYMNRHGTVVGMVEDFNVRNLRQAVTPVIYLVRLRETAIVTLRLHPGDHAAAMKKAEAVWNQLAPDVPFNYSFVENDIVKQYASERTLGKLFGIFSGLAIFIACMGLFGLSVLISRQRTKEVGIRKVLGASVANISVLLSTDFIKLVLVGICIASPLAWYGMNKWLQHFEYRIYIQWWVYALSALAVIVIALGTVGVQAIRAALTNPVKSLRSE